MKDKNHLLRNADAGPLAEVFLVTSALTVVLTRVFLHLTGFPQIGGGGLHIAHMLWGGLLMLIAFFLVLFLLNRRTKFLAAFTGGIGWGLFIDELGKFITADNDYWFKPTYALIYLTFLLLYFGIRYFFTTRQLSATEHTANSLELLKEIAANDFSQQEKERMLEHLKHAEAEGKPVQQLRSYVNSAQVSGRSARSYYAIAKSFVLSRYRAVLQKRWFRKDILYVFVAVGAWHVFNLARFFVPVRDGRITLADVVHFGFFEWGYVLSTLIALLLLAVGMLYYWRSYVKGLQWFSRAMLVGILLVGFFSLYHNQLTALTGIVVQALLLYGLEFLIASTVTSAQKPK